jgi:pimeloyl-ACP methyl ester carboxylesterase
MVGPAMLRWRETMQARQASGAPGALFVEVDGVQLAISREGAGPPVVCLHAIGHGGADFDAFAAALRHRYEILRVDWPGQGRSGGDTQPVSARRYAALLIGALDRLGVRAPVLIGNSIGGAAALLVAAERPVTALVLCDPGGLVAVSLAVRLFCAAFARFFAAGARQARWFRPAFAWYYRRLVLPSPAAAAQRERIIAAAYEIAPVLRDAWRSFAQPEADLRSVASSLEVPVWFAWARSDRVIPLSLCKPSIARMRNTALSLFDGGHSAFLEQPGPFVQGFLAFMAAHQPADAAPSARNQQQADPASERSEGVRHH